MATFRPINSAEVAIDAPLTQQLFHALKDNPKAIIENDSTAINAPMKIGCMQTTNPQAGNFIIMESTGMVADPEGTGVNESVDDSVIHFFCRNKGAYRFKLDMCLGGRSQPGTEDSKFESTQITANVKHFRDGEEISQLMSISLARAGEFDHNEREFSIVDAEIEEGDDIIVNTTSSDGLGEASMTLMVGVSNENAIFGADFGMQMT